MLATIIVGCKEDDKPISAYEKEATKNAQLSNEAFYRSHRFVEGWLDVADSQTGLIPKNLHEDYYWNAQDAAADNYPFMVITSYFTDKDLYYGRMFDMLQTEIKLTSCLGACPTAYDLRTHKLFDSPIDTNNVIFGSAEYMKDGLMPITEVLGRTPWSQRMIAILDDLHNLVTVVTHLEGEFYGNSQVIEVNGDLLQVLSRVYWMTGEDKYLNWAIEIGDHYLSGNMNPADSNRLRLRDHGCEIILGLCELYATVNVARPQKKQEYQVPLHHLLDKVLETGRNEHGLFYDEINPSTGQILESRLADTWGYILDGFYIVYEIDGTQEYKEAIHTIFSNLNQHYRNHNWENNMDGYADAIESALNLYNRERSKEAAEWIDSEINVMYSYQQENGIIQEWHGDGNFARTAMMYALWKTQGTHASPWRKDIKWGAVEYKNGILLTLSAEEMWEGRLYFDIPRHKENLNLPSDWPRINQFPEWFTVDRAKTYAVTINGEKQYHSGAELATGLDMSLEAGQTIVITVCEEKGKIESKEFKADLRLLDWEPVSQLKVKQTNVLKPKFPVIDIHNHLSNIENLEQYLSEMDAAGVVACVSLDGNSADDFYIKHYNACNSIAPDRFIMFFHPDFVRATQPGEAIKEAERLEEAVRKYGFCGVKVFKQLGLEYKDSNGKLIPIDDSRLDPIWSKCGELGIPVVIHTADPEAFFTPIDRYNERYDELASHPHWSFSDRTKYLEKPDLLMQRNNLIARHPGTTFICAHFANLPEDLAQVSEWLDKYPNMMIDISARIGDIGRQPFTARKFLIKHQDRILFGSDTEPNATAYRIYYRFFETDDEYIDPSAGHHRQGRWAIYGIDLPDTVLRKLYYENAQKLLNYHVN